MIEFKNATIRRGDFLLSGISQTVPEHGLTLLTGPVGCGKTTLLETICGLQPIQQGALHLRSVDVTNAAPAGRRVGYLPQDVALFDHLTVQENIAFGCRCLSWSRSQCTERVEQLSAELGINDLLRRFPGELSGGQRKAVGVARAVASKPDIVCLDEPFVALDEAARSEIVRWLKTQLQDTATTMLVVTHHSELLQALAVHEWKMA